MKIYDADGNERDWEWVKERYNLPDIIEASKNQDHWEVVALHEVIGPASMTVRLVGERTIGIPIFFGWPDDHVNQVTDETAQTGFGMGGGAYYRPDRGETGPHYIRVSSPIHMSDVVTGLGMIGRTNHAHLEPTFQFVKAEEPGPEEPPEDDYKAKYEAARKALSEIYAKAAEALGGI